MRPLSIASSSRFLTLSAQSAARGVSSMPPRYPGHVPLTGLEKIVLTIGSAGAALLNPRRADMIAALSETTSGPWLPGLRDTMFSTAEGRAILRDRPRIHSETIDLDALRALPDGTVGRTYCDWLERCNTSPDTRLPVQHVDDPELAYVLQRYRETHDFAHTLFGLPANLIPEIALKMFEAHQTKLPMPLLSSLTVLSPFNTLTSSGRATLLRDYLPWAIRAADECRPLIGVYWERRWEQGMDDLRQELGVVMPGHWEGTAFRRGTLRERERETLQKEEMEREARQLEEAAREASKKAHDAEAEGKVAVTMGS